LIVDVVAALFFKTDPYGKKISTFQIKPYYISKKESLVSNNSPLNFSKATENLPDTVSTIKDMNVKSHNSQKKSY
jgi:hypothetical protein